MLRGGGGFGEGLDEGRKSGISDVPSGSGSRGIDKIDPDS